MLLHLIRPVRFLAKVFTAAATPRQLALGFALGMLIGLVPKGNLIAATLMVVLLGTRVNLGTGLTGAVLFSWVGMLADPLTHRIGAALLTQASLEPMWAWLYQLPLAPWTAFNNTVVLGSLLFGLWLFYPIFRITELAARRCQPWAVEKLGKYRIIELLWGTEITASWRV
ncbi:MAG: TIGR03546 family protein [Planctomycetota bacterium]